MRSLVARKVAHLLVVLWLVSLATNDYLEVYLETDTGDDITIRGGTVVVETAT